MSRALALTLTLLLAHSAHAASNKEQLQKTQAEIEATKAREQLLKEESKEAESALKNIQKDLVRLAAQTRDLQEGIEDAEEKQRILDLHLVEKSSFLATRRTQLAATVQSALRLSRTPPQAALMMPGEFAKVVETSEVLGVLAQTVRREAEALRAQLDELEMLKHKVEAERKHLEARRLKLGESQSALQGKLQERSGSLASLRKEASQEQARLAALSKRAADLKDLVATIEQAERERPNAKKSSKLSKSSATVVRAKGRLRLPAVGNIVRRFGIALDRNETTRGITIQTRAGATVVAPYEGEVVFNGPFLDYGRLVILKHSDDFHTLLAGFNHADVNPGQFVLEGEPIGAMGKSSDDTKLYLELRRQNQPVNPMDWLED